MTTATSPPTDRRRRHRCRRGRRRWGCRGPGLCEGRDGCRGVICRRHHHHRADTSNNHCAPVRAIGDDGVPRAIIIPALPTDQWRPNKGGGIVKMRQKK
jgi:hypothetical protein